ncbi:hypothetical protein CLAFUW4_11592 [Fulvia fulva]|uniref:Uncharacterized protein n=1 Tax=Passalora fulva TaxID=5499 RepID=A0A9Q8PDM5_PASFU|nr:uncharacterized protein CLAFUR5_10637 [Fulvia fulva]KAK4620235.1 hypothetical protein CLAFUR4_11597 [Fulvia fulva]KAK4620940.1 hypothetical protein CLAFUR0_11606 [Fulvia fulva]UJO20492.1 hypothetical protein CLAFUR5_10637 [Fulvia fulva]WPV17602.1 hypothetical protein CLAFUW4_11592 [Fulvia fulva]WPV32041.1 hypothetical protein CLAFUW7_11596 [Fulvia fulva]
MCSTGGLQLLNPASLSENHSPRNREITNADQDQGYALCYICLCFVASTHLRAPTQRLEAPPDQHSGNADTAVLRDNATIEAGVEDARNVYSLSTFYWCSPGLQNNAASAPTPRSSETVIHKPLQSSSGILSSTMQSSPMPPGLPPAAYFDSSNTDLRTAARRSVVHGQATPVALPLPTHHRR